MKKPDITKGEWKEVAPNAIGSITIEQDICYVVDTGNDDMNAISAVPDMIDALILTHEVLLLALIWDWKDSNKGRMDDFEKAKENIESALKKAGVEL